MGISRLFSRSAHWHGGGFVRNSHNLSTFLRPFAPRALPRFFTTMDALTPARPVLNRPLTGQVSLVHMARTSLHSVTKHLTHPVTAFTLPTQRDGLSGTLTFASSAIQSAPNLGFAHEQKARPYARSNRVRHPTDYRFASGCSPPRLTTTQLPSATRSGHLLEEDFHLPDHACFQAHRSQAPAWERNYLPSSCLAAL